MHLVPNFVSQKAAESQSNFHHLPTRFMQLNWAGNETRSCAWALRKRSFLMERTRTCHEKRLRKLVGYAEPCNLLKLYVLILFQCLPFSSSARLCLWCTQEGAEIRLERLLEHRVPPCQGWFLHMELSQHESMCIQFSSWYFLIQSSLVGSLCEKWQQSF